MKLHYIELLEKKYPLCLSLTAYIDLMERYKGVGGLGNALESKDDAVVAKTLEDVLTVLMQAGRLYAGYIGEEVPPELPCRLGDLVDARDPAIIRLVYQTMRSDTTRTIEATTKNAEATPEP